MKTIILKKNEEQRLLAGHLWIYSNEIATKLTPLHNYVAGELVLIKNSREKNLGVGYINPHSLLCVRILTRDCNITIDENFFVTRFLVALQLRERIFAKPFYRLVFGESDYLPGLIIDRFADVFVVQLNTAGMELLQPLVISALSTAFKPQAILLRNDSSARSMENLPSYVRAALGEPPQEVEIIENGCLFSVPIWQGQKTGWFYDQRTNRVAVQKYVANKRVLDVFSYCGAFAIYAAQSGAAQVTCIESSPFAVQHIIKNAALNNQQNKITTICADAFDALKQLKTEQQQFDVVILDPPAFIKKRKDIPMGMAAYLRLHKLALQVLTADGILVTTSCSMHLSHAMFLEVLRQASTQTRNNLVILEQLHQAHDHPVQPMLPETDYLKGFILQTKEL